MDDRSEILTLKAIELDKLFGVFNHRIPLNMDKHVTIMYGLNGTGKTTILRMLDSLAKKNLDYLDSVPFEQLRLIFVEGNLVCTRKKGRIIYSFKGNKTRKFDFSMDTNQIRKAVDDITKQYRRKRHEFTGETDRYSDYLFFLRSERSYGRRKGRPEPGLSWCLARLDELGNLLELPKDAKRMNALLDKLPFYLIPAQRLLEITHVYNEEEEEESAERSELKVAGCANKLRNLIHQTKAHFGETTQKLDRGFTSQVLGRRGRGGMPKPTSRPLVDRARDIEEKYQKLVLAGLLEGAEEQLFDPAELEEMTSDEVASTVLGIHYDNLESKLQQLDNLLHKVELLASVVNDHYVGKSIRADSKEGLIVTLESNNGDSSKLELSLLSSGEQHILVLIYELIFEAEPNTLVMIDEPELSLHPSWQFRVVSNLYAIGNDSSLHFLLATHSPQIVNKQNEITVRLGGHES